MISYKPLFHWMLDNGVKKGDLVSKIGLSWATVNKLKNDENVEMQVIDRIATCYGLSIDQIVEIKKDRT